jgi:hypothetical protein
MEAQATKLLTPRVRAELDGALERQRSLQAGVDALSLDAVLDGKAKNKLDKLEGELAAATSSVVRLTKALAQAEERDRRREAEAELQTRQDGLAEFQRVCVARAAAADDLDQAAPKIVDAWRRLRATEELIRMSLPRGTVLPPGYHGVRLRDLAAAAVYRQHAGDIAGVGDDGNCFPGAAPPTFNERFNPGAIASAADVIADQNAWLMRHLDAQIQRFAEQQGLSTVPDEEAA